ncbi:MAG: bifunctional UDP-N-acetylglucosamine diphosphorylase/glucosamine-1-phosphate N-acetyltransferase GlmU [Rhodospirillaceae bacterium]|nr:bifunctional UDP-N-acetylglucosamine diphosphorylase/glucosamine-1-phosphate N-acetyltransferase GlmU [Rhodospirillaceae bacterium]
MTKHNNKNTATIVLAAGLGTRMKSALPKVLHPLAGRPMIQHLLGTLSDTGIDRVIVVTSDGADDVATAVAPNPTVVQKEQLGTGHAALQAADKLAGFDGDVLIMFGADPLITSETINALLARRRDGAAIAVLGFRPDDPGLYGRLIIGADGDLEGIIEARDATPEQLAGDLCNSGIMAVDGTCLFDLLGRVGNDNAKSEYYLTDIVSLARADGQRCVIMEADDPSELIGVDSRADLAQAEAVIQARLRASAMDAGATLIGPETVFLSFDTVLGKDVTIGPNVVFAPGVTVGDSVTIRPFCHLEGATIADGAIVGPFARLRPGADIGTDVRVGNFVEIKNAQLESGAKVNHLTYVGDARVGAGANIGAGTITCNYDGFGKHRTDIGTGAFIGSNTALVAPVRIGDGAIVGAGSTIAKDVAANSLAVTRASQRQIDGWAETFRDKKSSEKTKKNKA